MKPLIIALVLLLNTSLQSQDCPICDLENRIKDARALFEEDKVFDLSHQLLKIDVACHVVMRAACTAAKRSDLFLARCLSRTRARALERRISFVPLCQIPFLPNRETSTIHLVIRCHARCYQLRS